MLDELLAMRQTGRGIGRVRAPARVLTASALDREAEPASAGGAGELGVPDHVVRALMQPGRRMLCFRVDQGDDKRDPLGDRRNLRRRGRRRVAVDENDVEAIAGREPLDRLCPTGDRLDRPAGGVGSHRDGKDAQARRAHRNRPSSTSMRAF